MLSNINRYLLLYLLIITILTVFGITIITIIKSFKQGKCNKCKTIFVALLCIIIVGLSWIFNMGWLRVIMTLVLIPFINAVIFLVINLIVSKYIDESNELKNIDADIAEMNNLILSNIFTDIFIVTRCRRYW